MCWDRDYKYKRFSFKLGELSFKLYKHRKPDLSLNQECFEVPLKSYAWHKAWRLKALHSSVHAYWGSTELLCTLMLYRNQAFFIKPYNFLKCAINQIKPLYWSSVGVSIQASVLRCPWGPDRLCPELQPLRAPPVDTMFPSKRALPTSHLSLFLSLSISACLSPSHPLCLFSLLFPLH